MGMPVNVWPSRSRYRRSAKIAGQASPTACIALAFPFLLADTWIPCAARPGKAFEIRAQLGERGLQAAVPQRVINPLTQHAGRGGGQEGCIRWASEGAPE